MNERSKFNSSSSRFELRTGLLTFDPYIYDTQEARSIPFQEIVLKLNQLDQIVRDDVDALSTLIDQLPARVVNE